MIDCLDSLVSRVSVRKLAGNIPEADLKRILEVGIRAPSAGNCQPWRIIVVRNEEIRQKLAEAALNQRFVATAPVVLVICAVPEESAGRYGKRGETLYVYQDTAALTLQILHAVNILGYGACWVGAFNEENVRKIIAVPKNMRPVSIIPIGKIQGTRPDPRPRRALDEIVFNERFQ